jgi:DNA-binding NarL/FixJ family response regulator
MTLQQQIEARYGVSVVTMIVVEDSALARDRLRELIATFASLHVVGEFDNAAAAITALRRQPVDIVLLDIKLRGSSGLDVLRHIKGTRPATRVIIFTNHSEDEYRDLAMILGADYFFSKTHDTGRLRETLEQLSSQRDAT